MTLGRKQTVERTLNSGRPSQQRLRIRDDPIAVVFFWFSSESVIQSMRWSVLAMAHAHAERSSDAQPLRRARPGLSPSAEVLDGLLDEASLLKVLEELLDDRGF